MKISSLTYMTRKVRIKYWLLISMGIMLILGVMWSALGSSLAATYGTGGYSSCQYQNCTSPPSTQVTLPPPSGLEVNINLTNGQIIPPQGYTILVTPLNGQGTSFSQVDFYIDGAKVHSQTPAEDGTVSWFWNPSLYPGSNINIVVTAQDGQSVSKQFQVTIGSAVAKTIAPAVSTISPSILQQITEVPGKIIHSTERVIGHLPKNVKLSLPYFLFVILLGDSLFLILQIRREINETHFFQNLVDRERQSGELKKSFIQLISHYLRTPFTIITGALELIRNNSIPTQPVVANLQTDVETLKNKIDRLVESATIISSSTEDATKPIAIVQSVWRQPLLYVPILLVGLTAFSFDYLAQHAGSFSVGQISLIVQIVIYGSLIAVLYIVIRRLLVHRRDTAILKHILQIEVNFNKNRDELIEETALELNGSLTNFDSHLNQLPASPSLTLIKKGQQQLHDVVSKFVFAQQLKSSSVSLSTQLLKLSAICAPALRTIQTKAQQKGVVIKIKNNLQFKTTNPALLTLVLQTILDNAIEYSPANDTVDIQAEVLQKSIRIQVSDHGPGIPEDKKFSLFQAFSKVESAMVFDHPGMGFSLYLDKLIMDYLRGEISIESVEPTGASVTIILPILNGN